MDRRNDQFPVPFGEISLGPGTGNHRPESREFFGRGRGDGGVQDDGVTFALVASALAAAERFVELARREVAPA